jgi:hypothetical protein
MKLSDIFQAYDEQFLVAHGFDDAVIGVVEEMNRPLRIAYSTKKCIEILAKDMDVEDAREYFDFNVKGAYVGEKTPLFIDDDF